MSEGLFVSEGGLEVIDVGEVVALQHEASGPGRGRVYLRGGGALAVVWARGDWARLLEMLEARAGGGVTPTPRAPDAAGAREPLSGGEC